MNKTIDLTETDSKQAIEFYRLIREMTKSGCDVEVKEIHGKLKLYRIQKKITTEFNINN